MANSYEKERRNWIRAKHVLSLQYRLSKCKRKKYDGSWGLSTTEDMSYGGLSFYTDREYRVNDILELRVVMAGVLDIYTGFTKIIRVVNKKNGAYSLIGVKYLDVRPKKRVKNSDTAINTKKKRSAKKYITTKK